MSGLTIVISGPSGVGKGTLCNKIRELMPGLEFSVSATTRLPRPGEKDAESYFFISEESFMRKIDDGYFLEWAKVHGNYYGTPGHLVEKVTAGGKDIILELDVQGAMQVKKNIPGAVLIFIAPPSLDELERRIITRGTEKTEHITKRMKVALQEMSLYREYDYLVINEDLDEAAQKIRSVITAEKCRVLRNPQIWEN